ncbi:MAG: CheR family methyltransferase [Zavarzinella sp.]
MSSTNNSIHELLINRLGLNPEALGEHAITQRVGELLQQYQVEDEPQLVRHFREHPNEFMRFVDSILVPESWFFRQKAVFDHFAQFVTKKIHELHPARPYRILSAGCSSGEEPYSIAISLLRAGITGDHFQVLGIDLSASSILTAQRATYGDFAFRETTPDVKDMYFTQLDSHHWQLRPAVQKLVHFRQTSLLDPLFLGDESHFDAIFCRNVLIYLTQKARREAAKHLYDHLKDGGLLIVGQAESNELKTFSWAPSDGNRLGIFQKSGSSTSSSTVKPVESAQVPAEEAFRSTKPSSYGSSQAVRRSAIQRRLSSRSLEVLENHDPTDAPSDCWNSIGVWGNQQCPRLVQEIHCQNCSVYVKAGRTFLSGRPPAGYLQEWSERLSQPATEETEALESILIFRLRSEWLGWPVRSLVEITTPKPFHRIPHRGGILEGLLNIRGELHLTVRMEELLGLAGNSRETHITGSSRLIVTGRKPEEYWAFLADEIDRVWRFPKSVLSSLPLTVGQRGARFTKGVLHWDQRSAGLLDEDRVFEALSTAIQ